MRARIAGVWDRLMHWLLDEHRASYGVAVMRMGFGAMTIALILMFLPDMSYSFGEGSRWGEVYYRTSRVDDYAWPISDLFSRQDSDAVTLVKVAVLLAVAVAYMVGWRMRIISPLFVVVLLGFASTNPQLFATGHHQTLRVMLIFLLLADTSRVWSLDARRRRLKGEPPALGFRDIRLPRWVPVLANNVAVILVGAQLCIIYVSSALWKLQGPMWHDGTAVYYTLRLQELALLPWLNDLIWPLTPLVIVATYAAVYGQLLFPLMLLNRWTRIVGLVVVTGMHFAIGILLALPWFSLVMIFSDMIFIRTVSWRWLADLIRPRAERVWGRVTRRPVPVTDDDGEQGTRGSGSEPASQSPANA
ncbi:HTTM domain-containing protein [Microbacterium halophytorum]|uniref:HTTM domain-containing protein n=1 Tax=Microbacterium halophytorum TaxID=2067568 RepID=UPI000CFE057C|nr:HTTM domain-containing protein [Microbacterium halophytorum]